LAFLLILAIPATSSAQVAVGISVHIGPPALPVYAQPVIPGPGYLWTPGYWAYGPDGYYWVPGTWVLPPTAGLLWTPGYWGWAGGLYVWHGGYWGPHVGFYGGINYGFGFTGVGFAGGYWRGGAFFYNRAVTNVNTTIIHKSYHTEVVERGEVNHASFNGGTGGTTARPTPEEMRAEHEQHVSPTAEQSQHERAASTNREMLASANHGRPAVAATAKPGEFRGTGTASERSEKAESAHANESRGTSQKAEPNKGQSKAKKQHETERSEGSKGKPRR
jgi:YXWGXW repeat-containing protein